jgi:hypothetical protein
VPVFAKKLSPAWRKAFAEFEQHTGFEMMHQDDIDEGRMTPLEAWGCNQEWLADLCNEASRIRIPD